MEPISSLYTFLVLLILLVIMTEILPSEVLLQVLGKLSSQVDLVQCTTVCKRWSYLALELLWFKPSLSRSRSWLSFFDTVQSIQQCSYSYSTMIKRINLSPLSAVVGDMHIITLNACVRLERLTLAGCSRLTDAGLRTLMNRQGNCGVGAGLISIDLSDVNQISDKTLTKIGLCCPNLQGFNFSMVHKQSLVTDSGVLEIATRCRNLKRIKLSNCIKVTDQSAIGLAVNCPGLLEVDFTNCNIGDEALKAIFNHLHELRELRLSQRDVISTRITDHAFSTSSLVLKQLSEACSTYYHQLRLVDFTAISSMTDQSIKILVQAAPKIRSLVLNKCINITDEAVLSICTLGRFLHFLHLGHCSNITDLSVRRLTVQCNRIRYLDLACCVQITDRTVVALANLRKLKRVGLVKCSYITDRSISSLTQYTLISESLERIHLSYCTRLGIRAISNLLNSCQKLNHLSLTNVPSFMKNDLQRFCRPPPKEFTEIQRRSFCVYSGRGVQDLRDYLNTFVADIGPSVRTTL